ncbi:BNR-4 repeat-containing protein [Pelagicoccus mobilis]|uniref:BNR-4 repeat-containing protein n=1 Tax=Pelagicoccus mobilis TaxID=415221 RepID=A0A934RWD0_9BACT|nr:BNR-4 repeat-containing protein [Pelagicoccus mobilis]MBK1878965.1 BNR-4 repeat-containing protein [Pelagicoccus mobilis]
MIKKHHKILAITSLLWASTNVEVQSQSVEAPEQVQILQFGTNGKRNMLYDARQRPHSVLLHGRVYIVFNANATPTQDKKGIAYPMMITYSPKTRQFTEPVRIGPASSDHHYSPIIWADESDHLHVLHGCHRTPGTHLISAKPVVAGTLAIQWEEAPRIAPKLSYPTVFRAYSEKEVIAYRTNGHTSSWTYRISDDNGQTWTGPEQDVTDLDNKGRTDWSSYRTVLPSEDGRHLHMVYTDYDDYKTQLTPDRLYNPRYGQNVSNEWKYNLHYVKIDLETHEVTNAEEKTLRTPIDIDYSKEHCLIWDTEGRGSGIPPVIALDTEGDPTFLHILSEGDLKTHGYYYVRRENGEWLQTRINSSNHNWNGGYMVHRTDGSIYAYLITGDGFLGGGYMDGRGGGRVEEWISNDKGKTWGKNRDLTPDRERYPGWRFNHVQPIARPDGTPVDGMLLFYGWRDKDLPTAKAFLIHENS